jgi:hypothetical protein
MPDFDDSTLWRVSAYDRIRREGGSSVFAPLSNSTLLPTTLLTDLRKLESQREASDALETLAACLRHRQSALICLRYKDYVWPITVFPSEMLYHSPHDLTKASLDGLARVQVISCEPAGVRVPGHWMHERVADAEQYRPLTPMLWFIALHGPRHALLGEISGPAAYRATLNRSSRPPASGALESAAERLRRESSSLRDIAGWPGMSPDRASRLLNALYLAGGLMVLRSHLSARAEPQPAARRPGFGKSR